MKPLLFATVDEVMARADEFAGMIAEALGVNGPLEETLRQIGFGDGRTVILAGAVDGELATMNAFMGQTFVQDGGNITGYQSGFSATRDKFRGKGLWPKLLTAGEELLADTGGSWIFGFPNPVSHPLFTNKLNYLTVPMLSRVMPALALGLLVRGQIPDPAYACPDLKQLVGRKMLAGDPAYVVAESDRHLAFGRVRSRRGFRVLDVGAWQGDGVETATVLSDLCKRANASFVRIETGATSQYAASLGLRRESRPLIYKELGGALFPPRIDIFGGLADTF